MVVTLFEHSVELLLVAQELTANETKLINSNICLGFEVYDRIDCKILEPDSKHVDSGILEILEEKHET